MISTFLNIKFWKQNFIGLVSILFFIIPSVNLKANTITAVASGKWNTAATWDLGVPAPGDDVIIAGFTITLNTSQTCKSVTLNSAAAATILKATAKTLTITNDLSINQNSSTADVRLHIDNAAKIDVEGNLLVVQSAADDIEIYLNNSSRTTAQLNVENNFILTKTGGDDVRVRLSGSSSILSVENNCTLNHNQGNSDKVDIDLNAGNFNITGDLNLNIGMDARRIYFDMDGGNVSMNNLNINNTCTNTSGDIQFYVDQESSVIVNGSVTAAMSGGDDLLFYINNNSGTSAH